MGAKALGKERKSPLSSRGARAVVWGGCSNTGFVLCLLFICCKTGNGKRPSPKDPSWTLFCKEHSLWRVGGDRGRRGKIKDGTKVFSHLQTLLKHS